MAELSKGNELPVGTRGDVLIRNAAGWTNLAADNGKYLKSNGASADPSWATLSAAPRAFTYIVDAAGNGDYTTLKAAVDAVNVLAHGATIFVRSGTYAESTPMTVSTDGTQIIGEDMDDTYFSSNANGLITVTGSRVTIANIHLVGCAANNKTRGTIEITGGSYNTIDHCYWGGSNNAVLISSGTNIRIQNCISTCSRGLVYITANTTHDIDILNNYVSYSADEAIMAFKSGGVGSIYNIQVVGNRFAGSSGTIYAIKLQPQDSYIYNILFDRNILSQVSGGMNCAVSSNPSGNGYLYNVWITNNILGVDCGGCPYGSTDYSIDYCHTIGNIYEGENNAALGLVQVKARYSEFLNNTCKGTRTNGIYLKDTVYTRVIGNTVKNANDTWNCIYLTGTSTENQILSNNLYDDRGGSAQAEYGIYEDTGGDYNLISNNIARTGFQTGNIYLTGAHSVATNNITG